MKISDDEGKLLVKIARDAIETFVRESKRIRLPKDLPEKLYEKSGVFVTINKFDGCERQLRGCIGHPYPDEPLIEAVIDSGIAAAVEDPRFEPLSVDELDEAAIEVSVLTPPEIITVISPKEYPSKIEVGEDGLIVRWPRGSGLLLPQVPVEYNWDVREFLSHTCMKAGATPDTWLSPDTKIYKFQAIIFEEVEPRGRVIRKKT
ncbi:MAG: TIGR00296 family protein [Candidatus Methylarchaceae archaeon HK01B]|nr:TIGR00296 family protein [Candidatus Methylarchaceae archaeon HK01M]MCP8312034.1 TIGR00296 family protein [Candidatus Methylarchaceae archaeon HK02M1]MCP8318481.1 TIGR00296 family protein [Candidatus Methylarchaceae archaeon HK01B]